VPDEWVVIGCPKFSTLSDDELVEIYGNMRGNTAGRGSQAQHGFIQAIGGSGVGGGGGVSISAE